MIFAGVLMFLLRLGSRRQVTHLLRNSSSAGKIELLFGVKSFPHGDTLNKVFRRLDPQQFQELTCQLTETLIRNKVLYHYRLLDKYFVVAIDGTGQLCFSKRHCPHCLTRTSEGQTTYYHYLLEAKLVTPNGFAFSLMTEFIENPAENPSKQDCELKPFYRLARKLKQRFPRMPLLLTLDGLYAGGPTLQICQDNGWAYMIVLKDKDLPSVNEEFRALSKLQPLNKLSLRRGSEREIVQNYCWVDDILYLDSNRRQHTVSVIQCLESKPDKNHKPTANKFKWMTNLKPNANNVVALSEQGGRNRWKIENEGFNVQKNGGYELEHAYSGNTNAVKIFYYLLQIAHLIFQLINRGSLLKKRFPKGFGSAKNLAFRLLEAWRNYRLTCEQWQNIQNNKIQIRFDSS